MSSLVKTAPVLIAVLSGLVAIGCASTADESRTDESRTDEPPKPEGVVKVSDAYEDRCYEYSDVVAVHIDFADVHCNGWTGIVSCEYDSLSWLYGPGWGTCQCYNDNCNPRVRACRPGNRGGC